jgi:3-oxoacyl-[acyl-carrier protein] reductase
MADELEGQIALVTGAGRGIGRAVALRLAAAGCDVAIVSRTPKDLESVAEQIAATGARSLILQADVTDDTQAEAFLQKTLIDLGSISILVNSAGTAPPRRVHGKADIADWDRMLATCLRAPMVLSRLLLPDMLVHNRGAIVNIGSTAARRARSGEAAYAAAKAGLLAFSHALFREVRDNGIKVVAICPGYVDTGFVPPNKHVDREKFLRPGDVAEMVIDVVTAPPHACPTEIILEPQFDPER